MHDLFRLPHGLVGRAHLAAALLLLAGCGRGPQPPVYEDAEGFRFTPPPGWSERARPAAAGTTESRPRGLTNLPLPPLGLPGVEHERLMVRYDRPSAGRQAWLRVTAADAPPAFSLEACLSARAPGRGWQRESGVEDLEVSGQPAARVAFRGRWDNQDYLNETVAVRKGTRVYLITASFPASDATAREQVRQAVGAAVWK